MSAPDLKHLRVTEVDGVAAVDFVGSELMYASDLIQDVGAELDSLVKDRNYTKILLNFRNVQYLSSSMLAQLAHLDREHADRRCNHGGDPRLRAGRRSGQGEGDGRGRHVVPGVRHLQVEGVRAR